MLNRVILMGRLTADPELRKTATQKPVATFTIAVDRDYQRGGERETDFVRCVIWNTGAEFVEKYFQKGQLMALVGRLQSRTWVDRDDNKRIEWEVIADNVYFAGAKNTDPPRFEDEGELPF